MNNDQLKTYLEQVRNMFPKQHTYEAVVLVAGKSYTPPIHPRPKGIRKGKDRECYRNAYHLSDKIGLRYVEGFSVYMHPIAQVEQHAWCVDKNDIVIESTWKFSGSAYYGIEFDLRFAENIMFDTGVYGVINNNSETFREYATNILKAGEVK